MREDRFDDKIRELLNEAQEDYDFSSWAKLSDRLDHEASNDLDEEGANFIPVIKQKLTDHRAELSEKHWDSLKSDLDYIEERKERLYIVKALEAAIVLLLFLTYYNYKWLTDDVQMDIAFIEEIQDQGSIPEEVEAIVSISPRTRDIVTREISAKSTVTQFAYLTKPNFDNSSLKEILEERKAQANINLPSPVNGAKERNLSQLNKLDISPLDISSRDAVLPSWAVIEVVEQKISKGWSLGLPISYDVNFINTDLNLGYLSNQVKSGLGGKSMGISIAYMKGNIEIETGIKYAEKTFVPGLITNYSKSSANSVLESQLDHVVIKQIQVPLLAKIYAAPERKSTLYGMVGIAANSIIENEYAIQRTVVPNARFAGTPTSDLLDLKALPKGLLSGGDLYESIYVTGIVGIGIRSYIVDDVSWYLQPQYQHSFTSGVNEVVNKVNSLSIEGGFRFSF